MIQKVIIFNLEKIDNSLNQGGSNGDSGKWLGLECILEVEFKYQLMG